MFLSIEADVQKAVKGLNDAVQKQVPFAAARAVTQLAFMVQRAERAGIKGVFTNPRPFTQRSVRVDKASKASPTARVYVTPSVAQYLAPYEFGGLHFVPGRGIGLVVPKNLPLDAYGQIRGRPGQIAGRPNTFVGTITFRKSGQTVSGFWQRPIIGTQRTGGKGVKGRLYDVAGIKTGLKLLARFENPLEVHKALGFQDRAREVIRAQAATAFGGELAKALASGKK